ncbi:MAG TPA: hypothetical protein PK359_00395 [Burkholderiaceae bacterium]|jgi:hypothetical protein|nr:hypothetical protein [Burkholderiaceae bacterium]
MDERADRIRRHTATDVLRRIDAATVEHLRQCAESPEAMESRLGDLDREWDTDRALETEAATMGIAGLALGVFVRKRLLLMPAMVAGAVSRRVEQHTAPQVNATLRQQTDARIARFEAAPPPCFEKRLEALDREWDIERLLQTNASILMLAGLALGSGVDRRFLLLPAAVLGFFAQHALQGWCPPIPVMRRLGVRTQREIERERYALKALRGDFDAIPRRGGASTSERVDAALAAVDR